MKNTIPMIGVDPDYPLGRARQQYITELRKEADGLFPIAGEPRENARLTELCTELFRLSPKMRNELALHKDYLNIPLLCRSSPDVIQSLVELLPGDVLFDSHLWVNYIGNGIRLEEVASGDTFSYMTEEGERLFQEITSWGSNGIDIHLSRSLLEDCGVMQYATEIKRFDLDADSVISGVCMQGTDIVRILLNTYHEKYEKGKEYSMAEFVDDIVADHHRKVAHDIAMEMPND